MIKDSGIASTSQAKQMPGPCIVVHKKIISILATDNFQKNIICYQFKFDIKFQPLRYMDWSNAENAG